MKKRRLKTLDDLRRWLSDVGNRFEAGDIEAAHLRAIVYLSSIMASIIKDSDLEERIANLEKTLLRKGK